jgi:LVIVD repeat
VTTLGGARYRRCSHVTVVGSTAYVTFRADSTMPSYLAAVELSAAPAVVAAYNAPAGRVFEASVARNGLVMVAMHQDGLGVFERAGETFTERATLGGLTNAYGLALDGSTLCVADGEGGLATVDVSDPGAPRVVGRVATGGVAQSVVVDPSTHMAYVSVGAGGGVIVDVARSEAPTLAGRAALRGGRAALRGGVARRAGVRPRRPPAPRPRRRRPDRPERPDRAGDGRRRAPRSRASPRGATTRRSRWTPRPWPSKPARAGSCGCATARPT